jgi:hypothetical protein
MRSFILVLLLLGAFAVAGCMRHMGRNILEVTLFTASTTLEGYTRSEMLILRRDGTADRRIRISQHVGSVTSETEETGTLSTDAFEQLAKAVNDNDIFNKPGTGSRADNSRALSVVSDDGSKMIQDIDDSDRQIKNVLAAIDELSGRVSWNK